MSPDRLERHLGHRSDRGKVRQRVAVSYAFGGSGTPIPPLLGCRTGRTATRDAILLSIAKARAWIDDIASGRVQSFAEIAQREGKVERHIRLSESVASGHLLTMISWKR
jgi:hypothetical protein